MSKLSVDQALALEAFRGGFAFGADPARYRKRHTVDPATDQHWRRGFESGQAASALAAKAFSAGLLTCRCGHRQSEHADDDKMHGDAGIKMGPCLNISGDLADSSGVSACSCRAFKAGVQQ